MHCSIFNAPPPPRIRTCTSQIPIDRYDSSAGTIAPIRASATLPDKEPSTTPLSIPATAGGGGAKSDS